ncbi:hypothetical protein SDC9_157763 [bioreactor metagenome]|uniref:Uncharacterized protein n=1 Tax=bioreactor metagenome TaxID=1076179 RepID=A0A645F7Y5_9ZZZZ
MVYVGPAAADRLHEGAGGSAPQRTGPTEARSSGQRPGGRNGPDRRCGPVRRRCPVESVGPVQSVGIVEAPGSRRCPARGSPGHGFCLHRIVGHLVVRHGPILPPRVAVVTRTAQPRTAPDSPAAYDPGRLSRARPRSAAASRTDR